MSDRFIILDSAKSTTYNEELPILVIGTNLLQDQLTGRLFAQLKLQSIYSKQITAVGVIVETLDIHERVVETRSHVFSELHFYRDNTIGEDVLVPLEDNRGRKLNVYVKSVTDSNGVETVSNNSIIRSLPAVRSIQDFFDGNEELAKQFRIKNGENHTFGSSQSAGLWNCSCGAINLDNEDICHKCGSDKNEILNPNLDKLEEEMQLRIDQEISEKTRKEKKVKKTVIVACVLLIATTIAAVMIVTKVIPEANYVNAMKAFRKGDYAKSYSEFSDLSGYKKSKEYAEKSRIAFCESEYKDILSGKSGGELLDYYSVEEIKAKNTMFALPFINSDDIPELVVNIDEHIFIYTIDCGNNYIEPPALCRIYYTNDGDLGYYEKAEYLYFSYYNEDENIAEWIPMSPDSLANTSYYQTYTYDSYFGDDYDYKVVYDDEEETYIEEDEFFEMLEESIGDGEYKEYSFFKNTSKNRNNKVKAHQKEESKNKTADSISGNSIEYKGHYYKVFNESVYWTDARDLCKEKQGHLATISDKEELDFIISLIEEKGKKYNYWLGGTDEDEEGTWRWITGESWEYTNWREGQPNNRDASDEGDQDYLQMCCVSAEETINYGKWWDASNTGVSIDNLGAPYYKDTKYAGFICEWESI